MTLKLRFRTYKIVFMKVEVNLCIKVYMRVFVYVFCTQQSFLPARLTLLSHRCRFKGQELALRALIDNALPIAVQCMQVYGSSDDILQVQIYNKILCKCGI